MYAYILPFLGTLSTKNLEEFYYADIDFHGNKIQMCLNFENKTVETTVL